MRRVFISALLIAFGITELAAQSTPVELSHPVFIPSAPTAPQKTKKHSKNGFLRAVANSALNIAINVADAKVTNALNPTNSGTSGNINPTTGNYGVPASNNINPTSGNYGVPAANNINPTSGNYGVPASNTINPTSGNYTGLAPNTAPPTNQLSTPVTDAFRPVQQFTKPVDNAFKPVELSTPVENPFKPVQQLSTPVADAFKPIQQFSTPVTDAFTSIELSTPVENPFKTVKEFTKPTTDAFKPVQQFSTPVVNGFKAVEFGTPKQLSVPINKSTTSFTNGFTIVNSNISNTKNTNTIDSQKQSFDIRTFIPLGWTSQGMDAIFYANELTRQSNIARAQGNYQVATDLANQAIAVSGKGIKTVKTGVANDLLTLATGETINVVKAGKTALNVGLTEYAKIGSTGIVGENYLAKLGGVSQKYFPTIVGDGGRYIDQFVNGVAYESKVGYTVLTQDIKIQIAKDAELLSTNPEIKKVVWCFFKSPVTGKTGASQPLLDALKNAGIETKIIELSN